jgi:choline dehydrogenase
MRTLFDYIIVGAGSAGCVLANQLSKDPRASVLLIESGPADESFLIDMPRGLGKLMTPGNAHFWSYEVDKGAAAGGTERWLKGRTLGGSSSVNGMVYARGRPSDYDGWAAEGCPGWGWSDMQPIFVALEDHELGASPTRGVGGPLKITRHPGRDPICEAILDAAHEAGTPRVEDTTDAPDGGIGYQPRTIWRGKRQSAAKAFLHPVISRSNLQVMTDTEVLKINFRQCKAVEVEIRGAQGCSTVGAQREIILAAGAIQSPKLLQLSGIGPQVLLKQLGITVVQDSPNVGRNLQEHLYLQVQFRVTDGSLNREFGGPRLLWNLAKYLLASKGAMTHAAHEIGGYVKSRPGLARPDVQLGIGLYSVGKGKAGLALDAFPGITIGGYFMHPQSRGELRIQAVDAAAPPRINANYLDAEEDRVAAIAMVRYIRHIAAQPALRGWVVEEIRPGAHIATDAEILDVFHKEGLTAFHVSGTCRMGSDPDSVVDPHLRVRGVEGLRVIDTSVFPRLVSGNTNAPAMAVAMRGAQLILGETKG